MSSAICFNLNQSKILSSANGLKGFYKHYEIKNSIKNCNCALQGYTSYLLHSINFKNMKCPAYISVCMPFKKMCVTLNMAESRQAPLKEMCNCT